ncbi:MAG: methyltransferase [Candidatus Eremiobacteraeota bacterium]|nr:methyltransferase [Candidatus Eremiobacteraeota bacterium]MBC5826590.1 methyltransferase [Candidatus Eremiobacteraeota bacterium]
MTEDLASIVAFKQLMQRRDAVILNHALCAAARLKLADLLEQGPNTVAELGQELKVNEDALYRILRALASQGIFEETTHRTFQNSDLSRNLRTGFPGSVRPAFVFWGTELYNRSFEGMLYSIQTGEPAITKVLGMSEWDYMRQNPELAGIFDEAMTNFSTMQAPMIAAAYDFGAWESIMDVGGGNGILLSHLLKRFRNLRGVVADQPHVLERASQHGLLGGELASRSAMQECDFFREVPSGCRAYVMKNVIHDWDDGKTREILINCRRAVPANGALLLVEWSLSAANLPSVGKMSDLIMLVLTGGKERTLEEFQSLLASGGFRLNRVVPTASELAIFEALPT